MENRHGLAVAGGISQATGTAERDKALELVDGHWGRGRRRIRLGADKMPILAGLHHQYVRI